ncbi:MAG: TrkH family potassium uptake protein, partial [Archaeoglobaceae archaeon]|nr:TrkH family potassium uptake protein [Archaeoglobaceae archaeon]MDW8128679.1 TrkH family potassium uptake protein [Archaeoglobaceae archaeon]
MNYRYIENIAGQVLVVFSATFLFPAIVAVLNGEKFEIFIIPSIISLFLGILFLFDSKRSSKIEIEDIEDRDVYSAVALIWLLIPLIGAIPFALCGISPLDSTFEAMSGFTTTGATVLTPENLQKSILFWRSFMQWIGGIGIVVVFLIFLPQARKSSALFEAEYPAVVLPKIRPRIREMVVLIFMLYLLLTLLEITILYLLGIDAFEAVAHAFTSISTAGFSTHSESIAYFNDVRVEAVLAFFCLLGGTNFALIYALTQRQIRAIADVEFKNYLLLLLFGILILTILNASNLDLLQSLRYSAFQVISLATTTGYTNCDYDTWSDSAKFILLLLMLIGGCSGSTSSGLKVIRVVILLKYVSYQILKIVDPRGIRVVRYGNAIISERQMNEVVSFFVIYIFIFVFSSLLLLLIGYNLETSISATIATLSNVGPGMGLAGASETYANFDPLAKLILIINMWVGRLEILPVFTLLFSAFRGG